MQGRDFESFFERLCSVTEIGNQSELANVLNLGRAAVSLSKKKNSVPSRWIMTLSSLYDLNPMWLETGRGEPRLGSSSDDSEYVEIPKVIARLSAGGGSFESNSEIENYYSFRKEWINAKGNPRDMVLMQVVGNSMEPEIREGDMVLIDQSKSDVLSGGIYAVGVEETVMVKRLERLPGTLVLHSDNTDYSPVRLAGDELLNLRVIGKVLWASREYR